MSLLIPGPRSPGREIDVHLQPLIEELKELWTFGVRMYNSLTENHVWRRSRLHDEKVERRAPPVVMNEHEILEQLDQLEFPVMSKHPSIQGIMSYTRSNFLETDAMFLEFKDDLDNLVGGSLSVGNNAVNGRIPMTTAPGVENLFPHTSFASARRYASACKRHFSFAALNRQTLGENTLRSSRAISRHFKKYSDPDEARANPPSVLVGRHED
ncbi:gamma-aminobutyrate transaminase POP2 [Cucumis melo var. makuwa]|uniref:Gamma-aminobutyrate transaminase POP2 n=1 Tax=Cucumis melo var. makuwa TaxID=1194695 RepID=A0A5A7V9A9_CUCMM|nr:gamma-aminobutyrate transaminase POP2 [Cucumis melo var. makuwa]